MAGMKYKTKPQVYTIFVPRGLLLPSDTTVQTKHQPRYTSYNLQPILLQPLCTKHFYFQPEHVPLFPHLDFLPCLRTSALANHTASAPVTKRARDPARLPIYMTPPLCNPVCPDTNVSFRVSVDYISHISTQHFLHSIIYTHITYLNLLTIYIT